MTTTAVRQPDACLHIRSIRFSAKFALSLSGWAMTVCFAGPASAQGLPLASQTVHSLLLANGTSSLQDSFWVTETSSMLIRITLPQDHCQLTLTPPNAEPITWDPASTAVLCGQLPVQPDPANPPIGYIYSFSVNAPVNGKWSLAVTTPAPAKSNWTSVLNAEFSSRLGACLFPTTNRLAIGKPISISLALMDGYTPVTDYQCTAILSRVGDPPSQAGTLSFQPKVDAQTGLATPVTTFVPTLAGTYYLSVRLSGSVAAGPYERTTATMFQVFAPSATIGSPMTQRIDLVIPTPPE